MLVYAYLFKLDIYMPQNHHNNHYSLYYYICGKLLQ